MTDDLAFAPALEQARAVREREASPVELVELYLRRIEALNPRLNAYLTLAAEQALEAALAAEKRIGQADLPPFLGVPISIKDNADTVGLRTTHGTAAWADRVPERDAYVVGRLRAAGFVILGKTNMPEFGKSVVTEPPGYPPGRNPWDPGRTPGASSGGAAAALAAGLCPISHGSDGGGSIRMPAACCGVLGVKPSRGRISSTPRFPSMFSTHGPLARTVADAAAMLDVLAGPQPGDWFAAPAPQRPFRDEVDASPGRLRVAWSCLPPAGGREVGAANCTGAEDAATLLAELGHDVEEDAPDWGPNPVTSHAILRAVELLRIADMPSDETLAEATRRALEWGRNTTAGGYLEALEEVQARSRRVVPFFDRYDLLVTPTLGTQPPRVGELAELTPETMIRFGSMSMFTSIWNDTGQPAFSVPLYTDDDGMPVGVQLVGRPNDEATLFRVAAQLEAALPWTARRPPVS